MKIMRKNIHKATILAVELLVTLVLSCFCAQPSSASNVKTGLNCRSQGATITEDYFIFTDYCGNGSDKDEDNDSRTSIYRCDRSDSNISNCERIVYRAYLNHANSLSYEWGSNHFWVFDGWCNPASNDCKREQREWCFDFNGKTADTSLCGVKPKNFSCEKYGIAQGYAQHGKYSLKGYYEPNRIVIYENEPVDSDDCKINPVKTIYIGYGGDELEDVMVDGSTGKVYYTTSDNGRITLESTSFKLPPVASTNTNKTNEKNDNNSTKKAQENKNSGKTTNNDTKEEDTKQTGKTSSKDAKKEKSATDKTASNEITSNDSSTKATETTETTETAKTSSDNKTIKTTFFGEVEDDGEGSSIFRILKLVVEIMTIGVGILGVVGISIVGVQYLTAGGDEQRTTKAKRRMFEIVIGLAIYAVFWALVNWLLPGGIWSS